MITENQIVNWNCTKIANFLDEKTPNWITDNLTLEAIMLLHMKIRKCSPTAYTKMIPVMRLMKAKIARRR